MQDDPGFSGRNPDRFFSIAANRWERSGLRPFNLDVPFAPCSAWRMRAILFILLANALVGLAHGTSPLELSITTLTLPTLTVVVKNNDPRRTLGVWAPGNSWGDTAWCFEFRDRDGKISKPKFKTCAYFGNAPIAWPVAPGATDSVGFDLNEHWSPSDGIAFDKLEDVSVRVVLHQYLQPDGYVRGLFTGEVASPWTDSLQAHGEGSCVEWFALPVRPDGKAFDLEGFLHHLGSLKSPKNDSSASLLDWLGAGWAWDQAAITTAEGLWGTLPSVTLYLPHQSVVTLTWNPKAALSDAQRAQLAKGLEIPPLGEGEKHQPGWAVASAVLPKLPAVGIAHMYVVLPGDKWSKDYSSQLQADGSHQTEPVLKEIK